MKEETSKINYILYLLQKYNLFEEFKKEFELFGKKYKDLHFGYNFWKWENDEQSKQPDIFTKKEKNAIFEMMKKEFNLENG